MSVAVIGNTGIKLMPTTECRARELLGKGRAVIHQYRPFTIRLLDREDGATQPIEFSCDTGYEHIGVSIKSAKHEYVSEQRDLLADEVGRHEDCSRCRRTRRNRLRYRAPRFNNRKGLMAKDGFAPSIRNKRDRHIDIFMAYYKVMPITHATFEMGQFDTQLLKALAEGKRVPQGEDYQRGERYGIATLREAVFTRDHHKCIVCGKSTFKDGAVLRVHHLGFWKADHSNRLSNLAAVCTKCHTAKNHKKGGKLYGLNPKLMGMADATFMTAVRYDMLRKLKEMAPDVVFHMTYGARTKLTRRSLHIAKSHANDAYCIGSLRPKHRARTRYLRKKRGNNRILETFKDAQYIDRRDGKKKPGSATGCNRTNRSVPRNNPNNERIYRQCKVSKGKRSIRRTRYAVQPGMLLRYRGKAYTSAGVHCKGTRVCILVEGVKTSVNIKDVAVLRYEQKWIEYAG